LGGSETNTLLLSSSGGGARLNLEEMHGYDQPTVPAFAKRLGLMVSPTGGIALSNLTATLTKFSFIAVICLHNSNIINPRIAETQTPRIVTIHARLNASISNIFTSNKKGMGSLPGKRKYPDRECYEGNYA
jgi:hypothetical protein